MEWILCRIVESSCLLTLNIAPHISFHDPPFHKTVKKYEDFQSMKIFLVSFGNSRFKHGSVIVHDIFAYLTLSLSTSQVYMIQERCWFSQIMTTQIPLKEDNWLGLRYWTMILAICVVVNESKWLDTLILEFSIIWEHPFNPGNNRYCVSCLSIATWQSGDDIHDLGGCHLRCWRSLFGECCIKPRIVFHNISSEYNSTYVFLVLCLQLSIFKWHMSITDAKWTFTCVVLAWWITSFLLSDFCQVPRQNFL